MKNPAPAAPETPPPVEKDPLKGLVPGRIVHYHPLERESRNVGPGPWAAIVAAINPNHELPGVVTLIVLMPATASIGPDPVKRFVDIHYSSVNAEGCWSWIER